MPPNAPRRGPGRPTKYVKDAKGNDVIGLSSNARKNKAGEIVSYRYYATTNPKIRFGNDVEEAIAAFRRWESDNKQKTIEVQGKPIVLPDGVWTLKRPGDKTGIKISGEIKPIHDIPKSVFWRLVAEVFATEAGRKKAAKLTGIKMIRRIKDASAFPRVLSLLEIGRLHFGKRDNKGVLDGGQAGFDTKELRKAWLYWAEFVQAVGVANAEDVTRDMLVKYREFVAGLQDGKIAPRTVFNRYNQISAVINTAKDRRENHKQILDKLRDDFQVIVRKKRPKIAKPRPTPFDPEDFAAMLDITSDNPKWRAIVMLSLNCGLHPGECAGLTFEDFDLRKGHLWDNRNKTLCQRVSMLWPETVEALRAYLDEFKSTGSYLFLNRDGLRHNSDQFGKEFKRKVCKPAEIKRVTFEWFRDSGTNAASKRGVDTSKVQMWLGHDRGAEIQKYDEPHPIKTQAVVNAIYEEYMSHSA